MSRPVINTAASVRTRLFNISRERGVDFQRILQRYSIERLLARLTASPYREQFVLKGAMLYVVWGGGADRPTRDLDLLGYGPSAPQDVQNRFAQICALESANDGVVFELDTLVAEPIREDNADGGVRVRVDARIEQARIRVQIDVAFGETVEPAPEEVEFPSLLGGDGPRLRAYPHEAVMAEKFHAAVVLGETNSRLKDYHDLCALPQLFAIEDGTLARALVATFSRRETALPTSVAAVMPQGFFENPDRALRWIAFLDRDGLTLVPRDFAQVGEVVRRYFERPLAMAIEKVTS